MDGVRRWSAPALAFIAAGMDRGYQTDFWHHLARGREIVRHAALVDADPFTFTLAGRALRDNNWLTQVIYYRLYHWGGLNLVQLANALALASTIALVERLCRRASGAPKAAAVVAVLSFLGLWQLFLIRPQTLSFSLFVLMYFVLSASEKRGHLLLIAPVLMALWANLHGGFPIGLVLVAAFAGAAFLENWIGRNAPGSNSSQSSRSHVQPMAFCLAACIAATCLNPYSWRVYQYVGSVTTIASGRHIQEWLPPGFDSWVGGFFWASVIALAVLYGIARRRPTVLETLLIICFLPLACRSVRMTGWWLLAMGPTFASLLSSFMGCPKPVDLIERNATRPTISVCSLAMILACVCILSVPELERINPLFGAVRSPRRTETDLGSIADKLSRDGGGRVYSRLEWGEYLDWSLGPTHRVFMDGRIEAYSDGLWQQYCTVASGAPGWEAILQRHEVSELLLDTGYHRRLLAAVRASGRWHEVDRAGPAVAFVRQKVMR